METDLKAFDRSEWEKHILTPKGKRAYAEAVKLTQGRVSGAENILTDDPRAARLEYPAGGEKPFIILDMGAASPGGYPAFRVKAATNVPVVRISYADIYDYIIHPLHGENGDFDRGTCKYLGVELPVPPANPHRFELYTVSHPGLYVSNLIQGQQRWVRVQLDIENSAVEIESFHIVNVADQSPHDGFFLCNDEDITRLWYASTYTVQIASIKNANAWEIVEGALAPRALAKSNDVGLSRAGDSWKDYSFEFDMKILKNPGPVSAAGWALRARDPNHAYVFQIDLDGRMHVKVRTGGAYRHLKNPFVIPIPIVDGVAYHVKAVAEKNKISTFLDGNLIDVTEDTRYGQGKVGFCQPLDKWALFNRVEVKTLNGERLFADDFSGDLSQWDFRRTLSFLADGAKRDRLPWIGDLDWAGRNVYYCFRNTRYMADSLRMFAFHQTPEGYIWATCYPENNVPPKMGEYGYYQSDLFSAWFVPTLADFVLFTGDLSFAAELYEPMKLDLDYLWSYVEGDGIFCQRYDTSKGLWSHHLEDVGKFTYNNLVIYDAMMEGAFLAEALGKNADAVEFQSRAAFMKSGMMKHLWNPEFGFLEEKGGMKPCFMANAIALAIAFLEPEQGRIAAAHLGREQHPHGKILSIMIRGFYRYGWDEMAMGRLRNPGGGVNWLDSIKDWKMPCTTTECMIYPRGEANGENWGDLSHPDSAMAHILTGFMLGIEPDEIAFRKYHFVPHTSGLRWAKGSVPIKDGEIKASWRFAEDNATFEAFLDSPSGTEATLGVPLKEGAFVVTVNGKPVYDHAKGFSNGFHGRIDAHHLHLEKLVPGRYEVTRK